MPDTSPVRPWWHSGFSCDAHEQICSRFPNSRHLLNFRSHLAAISDTGPEPDKLTIARIEDHLSHFPDERSFLAGITNHELVNQLNADIQSFRHECQRVS